MPLLNTIGCALCIQWHIYSYQLQSNRMTITRTEMWKEIRSWVYMRTLHIHFKHPIGRKWAANNPILDRIHFHAMDLQCQIWESCKDWEREKRKKCIRYSNKVINTIVFDCVQYACLFVCLSVSLFFAWIHFCDVLLPLSFFLSFFSVFFRFIPGTVAHSHFIKHYHVLGMRHTHILSLYSNKLFDLLVVCIFQQKFNDKHTDIHVAHFTH